MSYQTTWKSDDGSQGNFMWDEVNWDINDTTTITWRSDDGSQGNMEWDTNNWDYE